MPATIVIDIDPILFSGGPITVRWYGLMISLALVAGLILAIREAGRRGISEDDLLYVALWAVPSALVGARLFHVVDGWRYYANYPLQVLAIQEGGLAIYGGLAGGIAGGLVGARRRKLPILRLLDIAAPAVILGQAIGRIGSFINGDQEGLPTNLPWATAYVHSGNLAPDSQPRHPAQLYEMLYDLVLFGLLLLLRRRLRQEGLLFTMYLVLYAVGRLWTSLFREDAPFLLGLQEAQVISIVVLLTAMPLGLYVWRRGELARS
jgi:prolipoprotein diacylglyceryl transferase